MRKIVIVLFLWLLLPFISVAQSLDSIFSTLPNWQAVINQASNERKNIFIDFMATWCGPCKQMDANVYTDSSVKAFLVDTFLSKKVQADRTEKDSPATVAMYGEASSLVRKYNVTAFPTFVFLSPKGELLHMVFGYQSAPQFLAILKKANDPNYAYYTLVNKYEKKQLPLNELLELAIRAKQYKDTILAQQIVRKYKTEYFDRLNLKDQLNRTFTDLAFHFPNTIKASDPIIRYIYNHPQILDSVFRPNISSNYISFFVGRDYILPIVSKAEKSGKEPDWKHIEKEVSTKYDSETGQRLAFDTQLSWYYQKQDWENVIKYEIEKVERKGVNNAVRASVLQVNNLVFDVIFKRSNNPVYLKKGLEFMEVILKQSPDDQYCIDTYANVLYKLGRKKEAIDQEMRALELAKKKKEEIDVKEFQNVLYLMKNNKPTWK